MAVDRDRTCANAGDSLKNLTLKAGYGRRRSVLHFLDRSLL